MGKSKAAQLLEQFNKLHGRVNENDQESDKKDDKEKDAEGKPVKNEADADAEAEKKDDKEKEAEKKDGEKSEDASLNDMGELPKDAMDKLKEAFSGDPAKTADAMDALKKISESKNPAAKKLMEAIDDLTSAADVKKMDKDGKEAKNEDADAEYMVVFEPEKWAHLSEKYMMKKAAKKK